MTQQPTIGRIVHYRLSATDAEAINRRRVDFGNHGRSKTGGLHEGYQGHAGNWVSAGEVYAMLIASTWDNDAKASVNGQVFLDGNDVFWATSVSQGDKPGQWHWPARDENMPHDAPRAASATTQAAVQASPTKPGRGAPAKS